VHTYWIWNRYILSTTNCSRCFTW